MKLQIGEKIKTFRRARGVTQEQLAEVLNVSNQSVSRWESGVCYPDLELLPAIANYFEVTLDDLAGMGEIRSEEKRRAIFTEAIDHERAGEWQQAEAVLREALKTFPLDDGMRTELALVLAKKGGSEDLAEAIEISEGVLERSTNEKLRSTARANLCFLYKAAGLPEKAAAMGRTLPHIWECRELLLPDLVPETEREETAARAFSIAAQVLRDVADGRAIPFSTGYNADGGENGAKLMEFILHGAE